jgi:hypothetical protein
MPNFGFNLLTVQYFRTIPEVSEEVNLRYRATAQPRSYCTLAASGLRGETRALLPAAPRWLLIGYTWEG